MTAEERTTIAEEARRFGDTVDFRIIRDPVHHPPGAASPPPQPPPQPLASPLRLQSPSAPAAANPLGASPPPPAMANIAPQQPQQPAQSPSPPPAAPHIGPFSSAAEAEAAARGAAAVAAYAADRARDFRREIPSGPLALHWDKTVAGAEGAAEAAKAYAVELELEAARARQGQGLAPASQPAGAEHEQEFRPARATRRRRAPRPGGPRRQDPFVSDQAREAEDVGRNRRSLILARCNSDAVSLQVGHTCDLSPSLGPRHPAGGGGAVDGR